MGVATQGVEGVHFLSSKFSTDKITGCATAKPECVVNFLCGCGLSSYLARPPLACHRFGPPSKCAVLEQFYLGWETCSTWIGGQRTIGAPEVCIFGRSQPWC
ncbi:hypothetical protein RRG08_003963 [Elysia crispata]|uniref:Uncharacterized protein n=1 Tax=Elysia crispata TaxID=231223 RepID=A0AAE0ZE44_9GAST|nr:hypothetical protein RRG08_003963 [Elysia crispata]